MVVYFLCVTLYECVRGLNVSMIERKSVCACVRNCVCVSVWSSMLTHLWSNLGHVVQCQNILFSIHGLLQIIQMCYSKSRCQKLSQNVWCVLLPGKPKSMTLTLKVIIKVKSCHFVKQQQQQRQQLTRVEELLHLPVSSGHRVKEKLWCWSQEDCSLWYHLLGFKLQGSMAALSTSKSLTAPPVDIQSTLSKISQSKV